jgi:hypothetical protein
MLILVNIISKFCAVASLMKYSVRYTTFVTGFLGAVVIRIKLYVLNLRVKAENLAKTNVCYLSIQKSLSFSPLKNLKIKIHKIVIYLLIYMSYFTLCMGATQICIQ